MTYFRFALASAALLAAASVGQAQWVQVHKLTAADGAAEDYFGRSVSVSGTVAAVGAPEDDDAGSKSGSAYLFDVTTGNALFKLTAADAAAEDFLGGAVAVDRDVVIVGAVADDNAGSYSGSAYLFDATTGSQTRKLTASDAATGQAFGSAVAIKGDIAVVGAYGDDHAGDLSGAAYSFDVTTGEELARLTAAEVASRDGFGWSVAIDGETAVIGAQGFWPGGAKGTSSAYVLEAANGTERYELLRTDSTATNGFGGSVGLSGTTAIVGAYADNAVGRWAGSAYLFDVSTGQQLSKLTAPDAAPEDQFGRSVAVSGSIAVVGATGDDEGGPGSGSVYVFDVTTGALLGKLTAPDAAAGDGFGGSVAIDGDWIIVGASGDDDSGSSSGSAYVFLRLTPGDTEPDGDVDLNDLSLLAGHWLQSVSPADHTAADFNGDGLVNVDDLSILAAHWRYGVSGGASLTDALQQVGLDGVGVPEPTAIALAGAGLLGLSLRRARRAPRGRAGVSMASAPAHPMAGSAPQEYGGAAHPAAAPAAVYGCAGRWLPGVPARVRAYPGIPGAGVRACQGVTRRNPCT